jgi:tRNA1(Val) A37 N6-methylase TrmN6
LRRRRRRGIGQPQDQHKGCAIRPPRIHARETDDTLLDGRVALRQPARGYRAGLDAALLAAACDAAPGARVLDVGCGVGGALLAAAHRRPRATFLGLEKEAAALALAQANIAANDMRHVGLVAGDVAAGFRALGVAPFDMVLCNPPFFDDETALRGPSAEKRGAWLADDGLQAWCEFVVRAVRQGGAVVMVHRADRLADLLAALGEKLGSFQIRPVHPHADEPAKRVLIRAVKSGRAPLRLLPPLVLHTRGQSGHTPEVEAILRGAADLPWL